MPKCCNSIHVGWICPLCGKRMSIVSHIGNEPVSVGKIKNVTIVQGDYVKGSVIKDSVVMGDVASSDEDTVVSVEGETVVGGIIEDTVVMED